MTVVESSNPSNDFAKASDTNDYSFTIGVTPNQVHLVVFWTDIIAAANAYADASSIFYGSTTFSKMEFHAEAIAK